VEKLYVFRSQLTNRHNNDSDIDLLVSFGNVDLLSYFDNYFEMKEGLEKLFNQSVDLVEDQTVKNPILRDSIDENKKLIYERSKVTDQTYESN
jgi:predicted nucleotidyltransferase